MNCPYQVTLDHPNLVQALLLASIGGAIVTAVVHYILLFGLRLSAKNSTLSSIWWIPVVIGVVERAVATILTIYAPSTLVVYVGGWVALKTAGGWGVLKDNTAEARGMYMIALVSNVLSFSIAIGCGLGVAPDALCAFNPTPSEG